MSCGGALNACVYLGGVFMRDNRRVRLCRVSSASVIEHQGQATVLEGRIKVMRAEEARRVRVAFVAIAMVLLGAGFSAGYLYAVVVRACWFRVDCVRDVLAPRPPP